jgi:ribonuclease HI
MEAGGGKQHMSEDSEMVIIYTDGGCRGNPGPGGWAYVMSIDGERRESSGGAPQTTNNKMELTAVIRALEKAAGEEALRNRRIELYTDSQYVRNGITDWIKRWERNGWQTSAKKPVKNREYWMELKQLADRLDIRWHWVKGHAGNELNEECDRLVKAETARFAAS